MADFAQIINRLAVVRTYIIDAINDMGGTADESITFAQLSNQIYALPTGMEHVRNGYQLFPLRGRGCKRGTSDLQSSL